MTVADFISGLKSVGKWRFTDVNCPYRDGKSFLMPQSFRKMTRSTEETLEGSRYDMIERVYGRQLRVVFPDIFDEIEDEYKAIDMAAERLHNPQNGIVVLGVYRAPEQTIDDIGGHFRRRNPFVAIGKRVIQARTCDTESLDFYYWTTDPKLGFGNSATLIIEPHWEGRYSVWGSFDYREKGQRYLYGNYEEFLQYPVVDNEEWYSGRVPIIVYKDNRLYRVFEVEEDSFGRHFNIGTLPKEAVKNRVGCIDAYSVHRNYFGKFTSDNRPLLYDAIEILEICRLHDIFPVPEFEIVVIKGEVPDK